MTPAQLSRDAVRVVDRVERDTLRRLFGFIDSIERDTRDVLRALDLRDTTRSRVVRELAARSAFAQTQAARALLQLGNDASPTAEAIRAGISETYADGVRSARDAAVSSGIVTNREASMVLGMGSRVDLEYLEALTRTTLTNLERVGTAARGRIEDAIVRGSVRGAGPRATARMVREAVDLTRYESERIVRTVFMNANNEARMSSFREMGVQNVQWDATNDERTCEYCAGRHGMVWKRDEAPSPPIHPHCRCVLLPWREDSLARGDQYYVDSRADLDERLAAEGRSARGPTAAAPFERAAGVQPARPVWRPDAPPAAPAPAAPAFVFEPATTKDAAEEYARKQLGIPEVDFTGLNLEMANLFNATLGELTQKHGTVRIDRLSSIASSRAAGGSKVRGRVAMVVRQQSDTLTGVVERQTLLFNPGSTGSVAKINAMNAKLAEQGLVFDTSPRGIIVHEFGHLLDHRTALDPTRVRRASDELYFRLSSLPRPEWAAQRTSVYEAAGRYALVNDREFFAESFRLYEAGKLPREATLVREFFEELLP